MSAVTATVRPARPADAEAVARIYVETWRSAYPGILPDQVLIGMSQDRQEATWRAILSERGGQSAFVAECGAAGVVGFATAGPARVGPAGYRGEVYTLYVLEDHQGRGLGRRLLSASLAALHARRLGPALVWVLGANPARFFYEAMGGRPLAQRTARMGGAEHEELAYGWADLARAVAPDGPCPEP